MRSNSSEASDLQQKRKKIAKQKIVTSNTVTVISGGSRPFKLAKTWASRVLRVFFLGFEGFTCLFLQERVLHIVLLVNGRIRSMGEGNVFTCVYLFTGGGCASDEGMGVWSGVGWLCGHGCGCLVGGGGVSGHGVGVWSGGRKHIPTPVQRWLLLRSVRILLECILVYFDFSLDPPPTTKCVHCQILILSCLKKKL